MVCPTFPQERTCTSAAAGLPVMPMSQQTAARSSRSAPLPTEICGINASLLTMHLHSVQTQLGMSRDQSYRWLQTQMGLPGDQVHIAKCGDYRCEQIIRICENATAR